MEWLAREMEQYRLAVLAVTKTHLPDEGESCEMRLGDTG